MFRFLSLISVTKERSPEFRSYGHDGGVLFDRVSTKAWPSIVVFAQPPCGVSITLVVLVMVVRDHIVDQMSQSGRLVA